MSDKLDEALSLSEEVLNGLETEVLSISSASLRCLRIARLMNDLDSINWLQFECSGYPMINGGIVTEAFEVGCKHGREWQANDNNRTGFFQLAKEIESSIASIIASQNTLTTQGVSVAGEYASIAMSNLTLAVSNSTAFLTHTIIDFEHKLAILRGQYYSYALKINLEIKFSQHAEDIFKSYRMQIDSSLLGYAPDALGKLDAAYNNLLSGNPESWSQALSSCRRVFQELSDALFSQSIGIITDVAYKTKSGKELDISGMKYQNRLFAVVDNLSESETSRQLIGSEILLLIDWIENIHNLLNKGVHEIKNPLKYEEAISGIVRTYILLGSIANLIKETSIVFLSELNRGE